MKTKLLEILIENGRKLLVATLCVFALTFTWANTFTQVGIIANAETINNLPFVVAVDNVIPEGTVDKIQGKAKEDIGTVQRNIGKTTGQAEGALKQAEGKAQKDIGEVKGRIDRAGDDLEDASDSFVDSIKDFFGQ